MTRYWSLLVVSAILIAMLAGCSCGEKPAASTPEAGQESSMQTSSTCSYGRPPLLAFKEILCEFSSETFTVGQLIEYRIHLIPVDDLNAVSHPWIDWKREWWNEVDTTIPYPHLRLKHPNFTINGLTYQIHYYLHSEFDNRGRTLGLVGNEIVSVTSRLRQNTVWVNTGQSEQHLSQGGYIDNLILDNQSDTVTLTMRFTHPGSYTVSSQIELPIHENWMGLVPIPLRGGNIVEHERRFIVEEQ